MVLNVSGTGGHTDPYSSPDKSQNDVFLTLLFVFLRPESPINPLLYVATVLNRLVTTTRIGARIFYAEVPSGGRYRCGSIRLEYMMMELCYWTRSAVWVLALCLPSLSVAAERKVAIPRVGLAKVDTELGPLLTEVLTTEVADLGFINVVTSGDIDAVLGFSKVQEDLGCTEQACMAEISGALGVDTILQAQIGRVGATYVVSLKLINIKTFSVVRRFVRNIRGDEDVLLQAIKDAVVELFPYPTEVYSPKPNVVTTEDTPSPPSLTVSTVLKKHRPAEEGTRHQFSLPLIGAGVVAAGMGGYFGLQTADQVGKLANGAVGGQLLVAKARRTRLLANIGYAVGAALIATGVYLRFRTTDNPNDTSAAVIPVIDNTGAFATIMLTF